METRHCERCRKPFPAKLKTARFCSDSCRAANGKDVKAGRVVVAMPDREAPLGPPVAGGVLAAVTRELQDAQRTDTALGAMALELARTLDDPMTPPAAKATLTKQLAATLIEATKVTRASTLAGLRSERDRLRAV